TVVGVNVVVGLVLTLYAPELAVGHGGVDGAGDFIVSKAELYCLGLNSHQQGQNTGEGKTRLGRCETQYGLTGLNFHRNLTPWTDHFFVPQPPGHVMAVLMTTLNVD